MDELAKVGVGFVLGVLSGCFIAYRSHYYALVRDEWNAGTRLRGGLNAILEKHRYSRKRRDSGGIKEFFAFVTEAAHGRPSLVDEVDSAINEFRDFLGVPDQEDMMEKWSKARHELRRFGEKCRGQQVIHGEKVEFDGKQITKEKYVQVMGEAFRDIAPALQAVKLYALKLRRKPWWRCLCR